MKRLALLAAAAFPLLCQGPLGTGIVTGTVIANAGSGNFAVQGAAPSGAAKQGNPVQAGGVFNTTPPTVTTGQSVEAQYTNRGEAHAILRDAAGNLRGANVDANGNLGAVLAAETTKVIGAVNQGTSPWVGAGALGDNDTAATTNRVGVLPAIAQSVLPAAATAGQNTALRTDLHRTLFGGVFPLNIATYAASKQGLAPAATPTDIAVLPGNATKAVIVTLVTMSCTQTTAGIVDVQLIKRSAADSGGTSAAMTIVPLDSANGAAVSAPLTYTANPTINGTVGSVDTQKIGAMAAATATPNDVYIWRPTMGQSVTLRGTAQQLAINLNSVTLTGGSCDINYQWIETTGL